MTQDKKQTAETGTQKAKQQSGALAWKVADFILDAVKDSDDPNAIHEAFNGSKNFRETLNALFWTDADHGEITRENGFIYKKGQSCEDVAETFTELMQKWATGDRPSLPNMAMDSLERMGLETRTAKVPQDIAPIVKAIAIASARAEMVQGQVASSTEQQAHEPDYHSREHFLHVSTTVAFLLQKNDALVADREPHAAQFDAKDKALVLFAAIIHDLDHPGTGNPKDKDGDPVPYVNEDASFAVALPIMKSCGMSQDDMDRVKAILRTTDPNGPHALMKAVVRAHREGRQPDMSVIDPDNRFSALHGLGADKKLAQMCGFVSDADLYGSAGAGVIANEINGARLTQELRKAGTEMDCNTDVARAFFFKSIVGEVGFVTEAGKQCFNPVFLKMLKETEDRIAGGCRRAGSNRKNGPKSGQDQQP